MRMTPEAICRAWLSVVGLQSIGHVAMSYFGKTSTELYVLTASGALPRSSALTHTLLVCIRFCLMTDFSSPGLQICHIIASLFQMAHTASEIFFYQSLSYSYTNYFEIGVNGITALLFFYFYSTFTTTPPPAKEPRRSGRLFAKHFMETDVINTPDTPEIRELRKRTN